MGAQVFANGREVSAKKSDDRSIAAMPDVCLSPPSPPVGPIPIPYPNFSQSSDTDSGTRTVQIAGQEVGIKNESNYKTSNGDEAATRGLGMGVTTATIQGKGYFAAWSFDVMFEGSNAPRLGDLTTHNHASPTANSADTTVSTGGVGPGAPKDPKCEELEDKNKQDKKRLPSDYAGAGNTNTNYEFKSNTEGVASESRKAHSKVAVQQMFDKEYVLGKPASDRLKASEKGGTNIKCNDNFKYSGEYFKGGHTEARIVEHLFQQSPKGLSGTLTMKINWEPTKGGKSSAPCPHCHAILCAASQCGLKIVLCSDDNRQVPLEEGDCEEKLDMSNPADRDAMMTKNNDLVKRLSQPTPPLVP
jgi:hypothetical protein